MTTSEDILREVEAFLDAAASDSSFDTSEVEEVRRDLKVANLEVLPEELSVEEESGEGISPVDTQVRTKSQQGIEDDKEEEDEKVLDLRTQVADMLLPEKVKFAMFGNGNVRTLLVQDPNRMVQEAVLKNPKLQDREVVDFTQNPYMPKFVLRRISENRKWTKPYIVKRNLVMNPKTPPGVSLRFLRYLQKGDIRKISKSRGLPQVVSTTAKKIISDMAKKKG